MWAIFPVLQKLTHVTPKTSPPHWWRGGGGGEGGRAGDHDGGGQEALDKQYFSCSSNSSFQMFLTHRYIRLVGKLFCLLLATAALFSIISNLFAVGNWQMSNCQMAFQIRWPPSHQMQDAQKTVKFVKSSQSGELGSKYIFSTASGALVVGGVRDICSIYPEIGLSVQWSTTNQSVAVSGSLCSLW